MGYENKSHKVRSILNESLLEISNKLNLSVPLKLKTARDCYACALKRLAGASCLAYVTYNLEGTETGGRFGTPFMSVTIVHMIFGMEISPVCVIVVS